MKIRNLFAVLGIVVGFTVAANTYNPESKVTEVTVYRQMAKESRTANVSLTEGTHEIVLSEVSPLIDINTLQVYTKGGVALLSATTRINYLTKSKEDLRFDSWRDSVKILTEKLDWLKEQRSVYEGELAVINKNTTLGSAEEPLKVTDISALADIYRERSLQVKEKIFNLKKQEKDLTEKVANLNKQIQENSSVSKPVTELVLIVEAKSTGQATFKCNYLVSGAGWTPIYEIKAKGNEQHISWLYKANIHQSTGYDWKNVKLTVSTGMPSQNNERPILNPLYVDFYTPVLYGNYESKSSAPVQMMQRNMALDVARADDDGIFEPGFSPESIGANAQEGTVNVEYSIDKLQDIQANNKDNMVAIDAYTMPAVFVHHAVPKKDKAAYLLAKITGWNQYNLLPGKANIFFDDMYVGQSTIQPQVTADTLLVSLGKDENVIVKRTMLNEYGSTKSIGNTKKVTYAYELLVKNNKNIPICLEVLDQVPISQNKDIVVEIEDISNANYTAEYGKLLWDLNLKAGETRKLKIVYTVKYPEARQIIEKN
jgi:uncharacterized protein (TIGR02231 family)